jgi:DNA-binding response OmpR family regulator
MSTTSDTIIVVENDDQTLALFNHMFRRRCINLVCISSNDLYQLGNLITLHQPLVIILDYVSIMRNYEKTCDILNSSGSQIPTIIMTTLEDDTLSSSFTYIVKKPFYPSDILMIIQDVIQRST